MSNVGIMAPDKWYSWFLFPRNLIKESHRVVLKRVSGTCLAETVN